MKKFTVPCDFNGTQAPFTIYIGDPEPRHHPIHFQADWLSKERGGVVPQEIMDNLTKLKELSEKNNVSFEELCVYALGSAQAKQDEANQENNADENTEVEEDNDDDDEDIEDNIEENTLEDETNK